jgi:hypothetical protein
LMRQIPAWGWSGAAIGLVIFGFVLGAGGAEGRILTRMLYPLLASLLLPLTLFAYMQQYVRPTRKLWFINAGAVVAALYMTFPLWHFGAALPVAPGEAATIRWWVNVVVLVVAVLLYFSLVRVTRPLEPGAHAVEDKPERLTV